MRSTRKRSLGLSSTVRILRLLFHFLHSGVHLEIFQDILRLAPGANEPWVRSVLLTKLLLIRVPVRVFQKGPKNEEG